MGGMAREVDRAIGALSTIVLGVGILMVRELIRRTTGKSKWEEYDGTMTADAYHQRKYTRATLPLFQHSGSCDCGALCFQILAPKSVEAFDDSNTLSCKKGRFPYLIAPTSCFEMLEAPEISLYESKSSGCQHCFCAKCGIHIFQFDPSQPDCVGVNVYCVDDSTLDNIRVIFIPKGARPMFGRQESAPLPTSRKERSEIEGSGMSELEHLPANEENPQAAFHKQLLLWSKLEGNDKMSKERHLSSSDDTQSTASSSPSDSRPSFSSEETVSLANMKEQLQYYLKRHLTGPEETREKDEKFHV